MTRTVEEIILEIEKRMHDLQLEMGNYELTHIERCARSSSQLELHKLLDWIKSEKENESKL